jgi:hypothetical protein
MPDESLGRTTLAGIEKWAVYLKSIDIRRGGQKFPEGVTRAQRAFIGSNARELGNGVTKII